MNVKEIFRIILLVIAIFILLVIALYEYVPNSRILSDVTTYQQSSETANIIQQISDTTSENITNESIIKSYTVTEADLDRYKDTYKYNKGKGNPFQNVIANPVIMLDGLGNYIASENTTVSGTNSTNTATGYFNSTGKNK